MSLALYISLGVVAGLAIIAIIVYFVLKRSKKVKDPILIRAEDTIVIITQRIHTMNRRIKNLDEAVTKLVIAQEKEDPSLVDDVTDMETIQAKIDQNKKEINEQIADIQDLKDYKTEIEDFIRSKEEKNMEELEKILDGVKEKLQYRFV